MKGNSYIDKSFVNNALKEIITKYPNKKCKIYFLHGYMDEKEIHSLFKNSKIKAISRSGEPLCLEDWNNPEKALYYEGQPFLRSANNIYPVPTILLTSANWSFRGHGRPSLSYLYNRLKGRCQICGEKMPYKYMSIEHIEPRSQGGTNDWFNITMTCKPCNSKKGRIFPYKSHEGKDLVAPVPLPFFHSFLRCRKEWDPFLFKKRS